MEIVKGYPPNIHEIRRYLNPDPDALFPWGGTIYNLSGLEIPEDVLYHENVHFEQQKRIGSPELWWTKYIYDKDFRENQELEAYAKQYLFLKPYFPAKIRKEIIFEFAKTLERMYNIDISVAQAEAKIRHSIKLYS